MISIVTSVATEPVALDEAKTFLRFSSGVFADDDVEDALIQSLIVAAREYCESVTSRALAPQTVDALYDGFPRERQIEIPRPPLTSVEWVKYKDCAGTETTMTENTDYIVDKERDVGRIVLPYGLSWPSFTPYPVNPVKIRFTAGYAAAPKPIKQAMLLLIGHWHLNREATGDASGQIAFSVNALLAQYKVRWFS